MPSVFVFSTKMPSTKPPLAASLPDTCILNAGFEVFTPVFPFFKMVNALFRRAFEVPLPMIKMGSNTFQPTGSNAVVSLNCHKTNEANAFAFVWNPKAIEASPTDCVRFPNAVEYFPLASVLFPIEKEDSPVAFV